MHTEMVHGGWLAVSWPAIVRASWAKCRRHHVLSSAFFLWVCMYICRFPAACEMFAATRSRFYSLYGAFSLNYRQQCVLQHRVQVSVRHRPIPTDPCGVHALVQCSAQFLFCCCVWCSWLSSHLRCCIFARGRGGGAKRWHRMKANGWDMNHADPHRSYGIAF